VRAHRQVEVFHLLLGLADGRDSGRVVGIGADEKIVVAVTVGGDIVFHHFLDDAVFFPQRHEDGDTLLGHGIQLGFGWPAKLRPPRQARGQPGAGACRVDDQIIEAVQQHPQSQRNQAEGYPVVGLRSERAERIQQV
jgi:hypothetical protein